MNLVCRVPGLRPKCFYIAAFFTAILTAQAQTIYVANQNSVLAFAPDGTASTFATGFDNPIGLAFDNNGSLFVSNFANDSISKVAPDGTVSTFATGVSTPAGLAFDSSGNLFVANSAANTVSEITQCGTVSIFASGFAYPTGLVFDASGNLFIGNANNGATNNGTISRITSSGTVSTFVTGLLNPSSQLAFDSSGNLFVGSTGDGNIYRFTPDGLESVFAAGQGNPVGMAFDQNDNLYLTDQSVTIQEIASNGASTTFASNGTLRTAQFIAIPSTVVPEPSVYALVLGLGALGYVALLRKPTSNQC